MDIKESDLSWFSLKSQLVMLVAAHLSTTKPHISTTNPQSH